jgi:glutamine synthetase
MNDSTPSGMDSPLTRFLADRPAIETLELVLTDLNGALRGKWLPRDAVDKVRSGQFKMPLTAVTADVWGRDVPALCERTGDGDGLCAAIEDSVRTLPWLARPSAQVLLQLNTANGEPWGCDPRFVLRRVRDEFQALGLTPVCAPELEFYLFAEDRSPDGVPVIPSSRINGESRIGGQIYSTEVMHENAGILHEIRSTCETMRLPLDGLVKELAPGQYEINLHHVDDPLLAADNAQLLKQAIKGVARKHGRIASFMAKPFGDRDGSGFHTHVSVLNDKGDNIFNDGTDRGSERLRHAIAGLASVLPDSMLVFAPHLNSWRRLQRGVHGPLAPTWGYENRFVALRVPNGEGKSRRIEHRIAGADANPYLTLAVILAGILRGLDQRMEADPPTNAGSEKLKEILPNNWNSALEVFEYSEFISEYLGKELREAFAAIKRFEQDQFAGNVTPLEYDSYLVFA